MPVFYSSRILNTAVARDCTNICTDIIAAVAVVAAAAAAVVVVVAVVVAAAAAAAAVVVVAVVAAAVVVVAVVPAVVAVVFTLNHCFYPTTSAVHPVSVLILRPTYLVTSDAVADDRGTRETKIIAKKNELRHTWYIPT